MKAKSCGCNELQDFCNMTMIPIILFSVHRIHVWKLILQSNVHHFASILICSLTRVYSLFIWFLEREVCGSHFLPYSSPLPDPHVHSRCWRRQNTRCRDEEGMFSVCPDFTWVCEPSAPEEEEDGSTNCSDSNLDSFLSSPAAASSFETRDCRWGV